MSARFFVAQCCAIDRDGSSLIAGRESRKRRSGSTETIRGCTRRGLTTADVDAMKPRRLWVASSNRREREVVTDDRRVRMVFISGGCEGGDGEEGNGKLE
ncbi:hypothetical protein EV1_007590 [Malus domestica]